MWFHSLPFQRFQALLTLFPKSFSSFPHGTCSLSVSGLYLALDEIYHLIYAPIPRSVTLRASTVHGGLQAKHRILTWAHALFQEAFVRLQATTQDQGPGFQPELIPVRSPLLRKSCLVPFPPPTYMLKFSGFSCLTSCYGMRNGAEGHIKLVATSFEIASI